MSDAMHDNVMREHPNILPCVESEIKHTFSTSCNVKVSPVSRALMTTSTINAPLHELFPVLLGARVMDVEKEAGVQQHKLSPADVPIFEIIETKHHGLAILMVIGYTITANEIKQAPPTNFELESSQDTLSLHIHCKQPTFSSKNKQRKAPAVKTVAIASLISIRMGCSMCGSLGSRQFPTRAEMRRLLEDKTSLDFDEEDDEEPQRTETKHLRCSRCWDKLRFPVWYCCRECQLEHYPEHKRMCGKLPK
jgi:hypothetical protein